MESSRPPITPRAAPPPPVLRDKAGEAATNLVPHVTLRAFALAAVAAQVRSAGPHAGDETPEARFLLAHLDAVDPHQTGLAQALPAYLSEPDASDAPLIHLASSLGLSAMEVLTVALAAAVEDDVMVGRSIAYAQLPLGGSRPMLGLLAVALDKTIGSGAHPVNVLLGGAAIRSGLLTLVGDAQPVPERAVSVPLHLCLAMSGQDGAVPSGAKVGDNNGWEVPLPTSIMDEARRQARGLRTSPFQQALVLRTGSTAEGRAVAVAMAAALDMRALFIETETIPGLGPWSMLSRLLPVFCFDLAPGERKVLPAVPLYDGPMLALCGPDGSVESASGPTLSWTLPVPSAEERRELWQRALGGGDDDLADELSRHHRHGSGRIAHLGRLAHHRSQTDNRTRPTREDVAAVSWTGEGAGIGALAQAVTDPISDEALVMNSILRDELNVLLLRCRARDELVQGLGASATARYHPGVRALFVGPSGTGKTLAAGWLATRLGVPLYRVDLASVTSKYIGETEKNLARLLARAEQSEVVLLFDEADSLFGKRTDVKEANDRFANAQTNYLLQRIESFDGITLLTSNNRTRFDTAFSRRLDMIIDFPVPGPEERRSLWQSHLGTNHRLIQKELNNLAASADLCGGHIRNAVLTAATLAHDAGRPVAYNDVIRGVVSEYRKLGRQMPVELNLSA